MQSKWQKKESGKDVNDVRPFFKSTTCHSHAYSFIPMAEDTQDNSNEAILRLLRAADERTLRESGNPVYLRLKADVGGCCHAGRYRHEAL